MPRATRTVDTTKAVNIAGTTGVTINATPTVQVSTPEVVQPTVTQVVKEPEPVVVQEVKKPEVVQPTVVKEPEVVKQTEPVKQTEVKTTTKTETKPAVSTAAPLTSVTQEAPKSNVAKGVTAAISTPSKVTAVHERGATTKRYSGKGRKAKTTTSMSEEDKQKTIECLKCCCMLCFACCKSLCEDEEEAAPQGQPMMNTSPMYVSSNQVYTQPAMNGVSPTQPVVMQPMYQQQQQGVGFTNNQGVAQIYK